VRLAPPLAMTGEESAAALATIGEIFADLQ
jgi:hypothetical protein